MLAAAAPLGGGAFSWSKLITPLVYQLDETPAFGLAVNYAKRGSGGAAVGICFFRRKH